MTVTATVTDNKIDITSTGGVQETWGTCVTAINTVAAGTITGAGTSGDPYVITRGDDAPAASADARELEISSGCKVLFEADTFTGWQWNNDAGTLTILDIATGSEVDIEEGCEFDMGIAGTYRRAYISCYGKINFIGTALKPIVFKHMRSIYNYPRADQTWDYVNIEDTTLSSGYMMYMTYNAAYSQTDIPTVSMKHITITSTANPTWGRVYMSYNAMLPYPATWTFEDWVIEDLSSITFNGGTMVCKGWSFKNTVNPIGCAYAGGGIGLPYNHSKAVVFPQGTLQPSIIFDNCTFDDIDLGVYATQGYYGGRVQFRNDCTFINQLYQSYGAYGGISFVVGTHTEGTSVAVYSNTSIRLKCHEVAITVQDLEGNPIENACVAMVQNSATAKEWHTGFTDSNGELLDVNGYTPILAEKEETATGVYTSWSDDDAADLSHTIMVTAAGYQVEQSRYEITEDKNITVTLTPLGEGATALFDSAIYDSTIY